MAVVTNVVRAVLVVAVVLVASTSALRQMFYGTSDCSGQPTSTMDYTDSKCNLGGVVYSCSSGLRCLRIRTVTLNARRRFDVPKEEEPEFHSNTCGGSVTSQSLWACDQCVGGSDTTVSTTVRNCDTSRPLIETCEGSGWCSSGCRVDDRNVTTGCHLSNSSSGAGLDVDVVSCSAVLIKDYSGYQSCSGSVMSQSVFAAGYCMGGMKWEC